MTAAAAATLLEFSDVHKRYGAHHALRGLSLSVPSGTVGLLGPNGAGKSTLMKVAARALAVRRRGRAVLGHDVRAQPSQIRARVGYMPERDATSSA